MATEEIEDEKATERVVSPPASVAPKVTIPRSFRTAVLTRPDGPYAAGQAVTVDPQAPWEKGHSPAFLGDEERMRAWRSGGKPIFVDEGRFDAWERDGYFVKAENIQGRKKEGVTG